MFRKHTLLYLCSLLLLCSGDVHPNPGPESSSSSFLSGYSHILNNNGLSIMHLNIQSLRPKLDILEVEAHPYDVLVLTETWLNSSIPDDDIALLNFQQPFRCDRSNRLGGGVAIYVREGINATKRSDLSINGLESLWVELSTGKHRFLLGGVYRPPDANNDYWTLLEHNLDQAFTLPYDNIIITGDFNMNVLSQTPNKIL